METPANKASHVYFQVDDSGKLWVTYKGLLINAPDADDLEYDWKHYDEWRLRAAVDFVNARNLPELATALDKLVYPIFPTNVLRSFSRKAPIRIPPGDKQLAAAINEICRCLYFNEKPTRRRVRDLAECLRSYKPYPQNSMLFPGSFDIPFAEVVKGKNDLMRVCRLLAWYRGRFENPTSLDDIDYLTKMNALHALEFTSDTLLSGYYKENFSNETFYDGMMHISQKASASPHAISREDIRDYLRSTISLAYQVNNYHRFSPDHGRVIIKPDCFLGGIWEQLVDAIMRPKGKGSVITCPNCGRFVLMDRASKTYCNASCYESYTRNHGKPATRNYLKWPSETYFDGRKNAAPLK